MPCIRVPGGIVCTGRQRRKRCACGAPATLECDWKVPARRSGTCDAPICERCSLIPAPGKDLCPTHAAEWRARLDPRRDPRAFR